MFRLICRLVEKKRIKIFFRIIVDFVIISLLGNVAIYLYFGTSPTLVQIRGKGVIVWETEFWETRSIVFMKEPADGENERSTVSYD